MHKIFKRLGPWLRLLAFFLIPILLLHVFNLFLLSPRNTIYRAFLDLTQRSDVEFAIVGSSVVQTDFNPHIITEETGLETFSISAPSLSLAGAHAATRIMYKTNSPQYVCLALDLNTFSSHIENRETQRVLLPFTQDPRIGIPYYLDLVSQDGMYLERLLVFRSFMTSSWDGVRKAVSVVLDPEKYFEETGFGPNIHYSGRGYAPEKIEGDGAAYLRREPMRPADDMSISAGLPEYSKRRLLDYRDLCRKNGSELYVILVPSMTVQALSRKGFLDIQFELGAFCRDNDIPFLNFYVAKESWLPRLDAYYQDTEHMDYRIADVFSKKFAEAMNACFAGEDISHLFYQTPEEYYASVHVVTNTWIDHTRENGQDVYTAGCVHAPSVTPEYRFAVINPDDTETMLTAYSPQNVYACPANTFAAQTLRVYARPQGGSDEEAVYYNVYPN